VIMGLWWGWG